MRPFILATSISVFNALPRALSATCLAEFALFWAVSACEIAVFAFSNAAVAFASALFAVVTALPASVFA